MTTQPARDELRREAARLARDVADLTDAARQLGMSYDILPLMGATRHLLTVAAEFADEAYADDL